MHAEYSKCYPDNLFTKLGDKGQQSVQLHCCVRANNDGDKILTGNMTDWARGAGIVVCAHIDSMQNIELSFSDVLDGCIMLFDHKVRPEKNFFSAMSQYKGQRFERLEGLLLNQFASETDLDPMNTMHLVNAANRLRIKDIQQRQGREMKRLRSQLNASSGQCPVCRS